MTDKQNENIKTGKASKGDGDEDSKNESPDRLAELRSKIKEQKSKGKEKDDSASTFAAPSTMTVSKSEIVEPSADGEASSAAKGAVVQNSGAEDNKEELIEDRQNGSAEGAAAAPRKSNKDQEGSWPLEGARIAIQSPLIECLRLMAGYYGRRTSMSSLTAGLPVPKTGITPGLFVRAARRADMRATLMEHRLEVLAVAPNHPSILALKNNQACILWEVKFPEGDVPYKEPGKEIELHKDTTFIVQFPETSDEKQELSLREMENLYTDYAFFVRPIARVDDRAGPAAIDNTRDWFWGTLKDNKRIYQEVIMAAVMINLFAIASSVFIMNVYDRVIPNNAYETLWVLAAGVGVAFLFDFILKNMRAHFLDIAGRKADIKISGQLFEQIMGMTMVDRPNSAGVLASHMREFETLRDFFTSATMVVITDLPFSIMFILIITAIGGPVAFVPIVSILLILLIGKLLQKPLHRIIKESVHESALKNALLFETFSGLETIKTQASEGHIQRRWEEIVEQASKTSVKSRRLAAFAQNFAMLVQQMNSIVVVIVGVYLIGAGSMSMGALIACVILSGRAMAPLTQVSGLLTRMNQSKEALHQLDELMKKNVERPKGTHFISKPYVEGKIEFKNVTFHYPGQTVPAISDMSFTIQPGDRVGIIGAVGSGKTTIERLLLNLYQPESGTVMLDGVDVRQIDPGDLRRSIGAVQQSPHLFYGSVRDNITMGHETAPEDALLRAAELSGVSNFLKNTTQGLDTQVGERGEALSGGQMQAVAIARALLYDPPVLVLDEPTASMDPASEHRLQTRLTEISQGKTTLLITHKGTMLTMVDKLMLVDNGKLVDFGPR
jgi:ATP-binding cassette subfamily C protein LapB